MAVYRPVPICPICGKPTAKAIYNRRLLRADWFGDSFSHWEPKKCDCDKKLKTK